MEVTVTAFSTPFMLWFLHQLPYIMPIVKAKVEFMHFAKLKELEKTQNNNNTLRYFTFFWKSSPPILFLSLPPQNSLVLLSFLLRLPEHTVPYLLETVSRCISPTFLPWHKYIFMWWLSIHAALQSTRRHVIVPSWNAAEETALKSNLCTWLQYLRHPIRYIPCDETLQEF